MEFKDFFTSLSNVDTVIGLIAMIVIGFLGYLIYNQKYKIKQIANVINKADTNVKADLARDLSGVISYNKISKLSKENSFDFIKMKLESESNRFKSRMKLLKTSILFLFVIIIVLIVKEYFIDFQKYKRTKIDNSKITHGNKSPISVGNGVTFNFIETNKDSLKSKGQSNISKDSIK